jgi:hypothetical protein
MCIFPQILGTNFETAEAQYDLPDHQNNATVPCERLPHPVPVKSGDSYFGHTGQMLLCYVQ